MRFPRSEPDWQFQDPVLTTVRAGLAVRDQPARGYGSASNAFRLAPMQDPYPRDSTTGYGCGKIDIFMSRAPFITFEGGEGCGKSTQVKRLAARLESLGLPVLVTREPGGTPIGESIRELLQFAPQSAQMTPETELLLFEASRSQLVREVIKPALTKGHWVISDRFFDSTIVYQGAARKLDNEMVEQLNRFAVGDCVPDLTFVLDVDLATAQARMKGPRRADRMEQQPVDFHERVRAAYQALADQEAGRVVLIDGAAEPDKIEDKIWETMGKRFPALSANSPKS